MKDAKHIWDRVDLSSGSVETRHQGTFGNSTLDVNDRMNNGGMSFLRWRCLSSDVYLVSGKHPAM